MGQISLFESCPQKIKKIHGNYSGWGCYEKKILLYFLFFRGLLGSNFESSKKIEKKHGLKKNQKKIIRATLVGHVMRFVYLLFLNFIGCLFGSNFAF